MIILLIFFFRFFFNREDKNKHISLFSSFFIYKSLYIGSNCENKLKFVINE